MSPMEATGESGRTFTPKYSSMMIASGVKSVQKLLEPQGERIKPFVLSVAVPHSRSMNGIRNGHS
jgi:hypothetical protein